MNPDSEQLAQLISSVSDSPYRELVRFDSLRYEMREGFTRLCNRLDLMEARLDRHARSLSEGQSYSRE